MAKSLPFTPQRIVVGLAAFAWVVLAIVAPWQSYGDSHSTAFAVVLAVWGWLCWTSVFIGFLVPSPITLTITRCITPLAIVVSLVATAPLAIFASIVVFIICSSALFVDAFVQGGAYGDEKRFSLRTPVPHMAPAALVWALLCGSLIGGSLFIAAQNYIVGVPLLVAGIVLVRIVPKRLHRLARRWLVLVPAGLVVHDHMVLAETHMTSKNGIASLRVVTENGEAADFTGGVLGPRLSVEMKEADKVVLSKITAKTLGTTEALHVKTFVIAPRRIHVAMAALS